MTPILICSILFAPAPAPIHHVSVVETQKTVASYSGGLKKTGNPLNLAIAGEGFFKLTRPDGTAAYTRNGNFHLDANGSIAFANGDLLDPQVNLPEGCTAISISQTGEVCAVPPDETAALIAGEIHLSTFSNPLALSHLSGSLFVQTQAAGDDCVQRPGGSGFGTLQSGFLETSNLQELTRIVKRLNR